MAIAPEAIHAIATSVPGVINCHAIASRSILGQVHFMCIFIVLKYYLLAIAMCQLRKSCFKMLDFLLS